MSAHETGGPAFPAFQPLERFDDELGRYTETMQPVGGMTLRDYFAAQALIGLVSAGHANVMGWTPQEFAVASFNLADALLAERAKA